jgi:hypothetical protein
MDILPSATFKIWPSADAILKTQIREIDSQRIPKITNALKIFHYF